MFATELAGNCIPSLLACWFEDIVTIVAGGKTYTFHYAIRDEGSYHTKNLIAHPPALLLCMTGKITNTYFPPMHHDMHTWIINIQQAQAQLP